LHISRMKQQIRPCPSVPFLVRWLRRETAGFEVLCVADFDLRQV